MDHDYVQTLEAIMSRTGVGYAAVALAAGVSPTTTRYVTLSRELPKQSEPRARLTRWIERNRDASRRDELRFV